jgi:putative transposase
MHNKDWSGHLCQGRFSSFPMDEDHLYACARYVELNPVQAGLVSKAWQYTVGAALLLMWRAGTISC